MRVVLRESSPLVSWRDIRPISSELIRVECLRVVDRARAAFQIDDLASSRQRSEVLQALNAFALAPVSGQILDRAADPFPTALGTLDAIHLATAIELRVDYPDLAFATHDRELATAARSVGFEVQGA